jgi:hypothetical protein
VKNHWDIIVKTHELRNYLVKFSHNYQYHQINYLNVKSAIGWVNSIKDSQFKLHLKFQLILPLCLTAIHFETIKY